VDDEDDLADFERDVEIGSMDRVLPLFQILIRHKQVNFIHQYRFELLQKMKLFVKQVRQPEIKSENTQLHDTHICAYVGFVL
jgi:hypothetical protein